MGREPSEATQLRTLRAEHARLKSSYIRLQDERQMYFSRAIRAEAELVEWKKRFDALLKLGGKSDG